MGISSIQIAELYSRLVGSLGLAWLAGQGGATRQLSLDDEGDVSRIGQPFVQGHSNLLPLFGAREVAGIAGGEGWLALLDRFAGAPPAAVLLAEGVTPPTELVIYAEDHDLPLFVSALGVEEIGLELQRWLGARLVGRVVEHGVFLDVFGIGTLLTGSAGVGKSEVALELLNRGHRLIADDAPEFIRNEGYLIGTCPSLLQDFLEVRGLGILNVRRMFGDQAIQARKPLELMVQLQWMDEPALQALDRLRWQHSERELLGVAIDLITLPVTAGRELGILVETAVRLYRQRRDGYDSSEEFIQRQSSAISLSKGE